MYNEYITPTAAEPLECATIVHAATENKEMNMINMDSKREYTKLSFFVFVWIVKNPYLFRIS